MTDLVAGRIGAMFSPASTVLQHVESGALKALASTEKQRTAAAPDLPTVGEAGLPGFDTSVWFALMAPAGTPQSIIQTLSQAVEKALRSEEVVSVFKKQGIDPLVGGPDDLAKYIESESRKWEKVAREAGLKR